MTTQHVKVGDVVAWDDVPSGAMVADVDGDYAVHISGDGFYVAQPSSDQEDLKCWIGFEVDQWAWIPPYGNDGVVSMVSIIALNLTGNETADELRALAEAFERDHPAA